jgi:signal transduction histidine kinase
MNYEKPISSILITMGANNLQLPLLIIRALEILVYLLVIFLAIRRRHGWASAPVFLAVYALVALVLQAVRILYEFGLLGGLDAAARQPLDYYGVVVLAILFYQTLRVFLTNERKLSILLAGLGWTVALLFLKNTLATFLTLVLFTGLAVWLFLRTLGQTRQPLHRNRLIYLLPTLALVIANDLLVYYRPGTQDSYLRMAATAMLAYVILRHNIPDTRDMTRQLLIYLLSTLLTVSVYIGGFLLANTIFGDMPGYDPLLAGAGLAVFISLIYTPLFDSIRALVNRLFKLESYDPSQTLREYSSNISNILDLEKLATVAVGLIMESLDVKKGFLFTVDPEIGADAKNLYRLTGIHAATSVGPTPTGNLAESSTIVRFLREERKPLLQYDIDFAPEFIDAPLAERKWLSGLGLDVYVPIYAKGEWIGLLALGPKPARRYTDDDLVMLTTIASQTAIALENARLVENLKKLNVQVREAYAYLDKANHDLAKLEMTKSNFISIASHELRTPLTVARGYAEMLLEDPALPDPVREMVKGIHKSTIRQHEIMDSMFDIAQIDSRSIELHRQDVFLTELIRSVAQEQSKFVAERKQELNLDLPQMPSIKADPNTLRKLFYHLIINAIKFTPDGGKITVTARQVAPNNRDLPEGGVEIVVSDTGVGIDKGYQEVIFTKFYQPGELLNKHSTGKTKFKGSGVGLGLALSRGIVEVHGGKIWVESPGYDEEKCPGSVFHIILPLRSQGESKTIRMGSAVKLKL